MIVPNDLPSKIMLYRDIQWNTSNHRVVHLSWRLPPWRCIIYVFALLAYHIYASFPIWFICSYFPYLLFPSSVFYKSQRQFPCMGNGQNQSSSTSVDIANLVETLSK